MEGRGARRRMGTGDDVREDDVRAIVPGTLPSATQDHA
jgi:hypothetical protein